LIPEIKLRRRSSRETPDEKDDHWLGRCRSHFPYTHRRLCADRDQFWHAFTGRLGELVAAQVEQFNASQSDYTVVQSHKGNYSETLNAGIAAFRAGEQPHILMVFEVGTATMMAAEGAIRPVYEVMEAGASSIPMPISAR
jgi:ABC-type glycerol-3-phosphate transport system substrate-binding protein